MKKIAMLVSTMIIFSSSLLIAADTATATFSGDVAGIANISVTNEVSNLNLAGVETNVKIFDFAVQSNGATGFSVKFSSSQNGQLRHSSYNVLNPKEASFLAYDITIAAQMAGGAMTGDDVTNLTLDTDKTVSYTHDAPTDGKVWDVQITHPLKTLFNGTFTETITLTLTNI